MERTGRNEVATLNGHSDRVKSVAFSPDGQHVATGSLDDTAKLWRISDGACVNTLSDFKGEVLGVVWSPDGRYLACVNGGHWTGLDYVAASAYEAVIFEPN